MFRRLKEKIRSRSCTRFAVLAMAAMMMWAPMVVSANDLVNVINSSNDNVLYIGESVTLTPEWNNFRFRNWKVIFTVSGGTCELYFPDFGTYESSGYKFDMTTGRVLKITNVSNSVNGEMKVQLLYYFPTGEYGGNDFIVFKTSSITRDEAKYGTLFDDSATVVTSIISFMQSFLSFITANPLILLAFIIVLAGLGVGLLVRVFKSS